MTDKALHWRDHLNQAAQSDKRRNSVDVRCLRTLLSEELKLASIVGYKNADISRLESRIAAKDEYTSALEAERDDLSTANACQATRHAELKDKCRQLQGDLNAALADAASCAKALAETTAPMPYASAFELLAFAVICVLAGYTLHLGFPHLASWVHV